MIRAVCISLVVLLSGGTFRQSAEEPSAFEVADVHVSPARSSTAMAGGVLRGERYDVQNATMLDLIKTAYGVTDDKVLGGPSWLESDRFDVLAKAPPSATPETARVMLQSLLADRFKLTIHNDTKPLPVYALSAGRSRPKMKETDGAGAAGCRPKPPAGAGGGDGVRGSGGVPSVPATIPPLVVECHNMTMAAFAEQLHQMAGGYVGDHPLVDLTKLEGAWDFEIKWTGRGQLAAAGGDGISLFDAVDKQLGLKLELQNVSMPVIVVDKVNEKPTDNLPGIGQNLPVARPEFEVADVKRSDPNSQQRFIRPWPGGRWDASGPLRDIIGFAFDIAPNFRADLLMAPRWTESTRFDIVAKAPTGPSTAGAGGRASPVGPTVDDTTLRLMVRALLVDRFKLATHTEDQPATVYALTVPKGEPKLKKADDSMRSGCKPDPGALPVSGNPVPAIAFRCQNTTLADLAKNVQLWAGPDLDHPVIDTTGIHGGWDFVLIFSPRALLQARAGDTASAGTTAAADPSTGYTIFEALEKELGLKLEVQKHTIPVIVVDHVEEKPSGDNLRF